VIWGLVIGYHANQYPYPHVFHHDIDPPVLALELSHDAGDIDAVLHRSQAGNQATAQKTADAENSMATVNWLDLVFIPLYAFAIWSLARLFTTETRLLVIFVTGAAVFDYVEDVLIFSALRGNNPLIFIPSVVKWGLLGVVFILLAGILLRSNSPVYTLPTKRLLAIGFCISGMLILMDVALGGWIGYSHLALGTAIFSALLVANIIGLLGHYAAIPALKQTFIENFCEERKKLRDTRATAIRAERAD
jgi:hypothetical protein